ncbi:NAD-dependent protein deacetylase sirtuin-2 [Blyttiomyces sp. JEL0837]|nr:NAD-dependent protein deacetylase sirtuin-2 [Blyttiomyces sp. JEL0837]
MFARQILARGVPSPAFKSIPSRSFHATSLLSHYQAKVQMPAPSFRAPAVHNKEFTTISLEDYKGKWLVLFFYPLDFTFVCPSEIIAFSDRVDEFKKLGAEVVGASVDSKFSHLAWINQPRKEGGLGEMKIPLLSDVTKQISADYGVLIEKGDDIGLSLRGTFIIDPKQVVRQITVNDLPIGRNIDETLRLLEALQFTEKHGEVCPANWKKGGKTMIAHPEKSKEYFRANVTAATITSESVTTSSSPPPPPTGTTSGQGSDNTNHSPSPSSPTSPHVSSSGHPIPQFSRGPSGHPKVLKVVKLTPLEKKKMFPHLNILPDSSIESFAKYIKDNECKRIVVMTGAGISTSAGIPDFRTPGTGLYSNLAKYNLPYPQAVFDISYFRFTPQPFFTLAKELYPGSFKPTLCHYFLRLLAEEEMLLRCYTQNIDTLERVAGMPDSYLVEAHGSFASASCVGRHTRVEPKPPSTDSSVEDDSEDEMVEALRTGAVTVIPPCGRKYSQEWVRRRIFAGEIPECEQCTGIVKPDITFFGEGLPTRFHTLHPIDLRQAEALIVIGTSLQVQPFASLISRLPEKVPRLLINREVAGVGYSGGFDFTGEVQEYRRDAVYLGNCDDGCLKLAELLGMKDRLHKLMKDEHVRLDNEKNGTTNGSSTSSKLSAEDYKSPPSPVGVSPIDAMLGDLSRLNFGVD